MHIPKVHENEGQYFRVPNKRGCQISGGGGQNIFLNQEAGVQIIPGGGQTTSKKLHVFTIITITIIYFFMLFHSITSGESSTWKCSFIAKFAPEMDPVILGGHV